MPELPEVQTTVNGIKKMLIGRTITDAWTDLAKKTVSRPDYKDTIKHLPFFEQFQKSVIGATIVSAERRAKNILIHLSNQRTILIHMKMTGHLLYGTYHKEKGIWEPHPEERNEALRDPFNRFIHFVLTFDNGKHLVFCDSRKFGKVTLLNTEGIFETKHMKDLGPEIVVGTFTFKQFKERINKKKNGKVKGVLMDQTVISGVGNIYSDEALWLAGIHPNSIISKIPNKKLEELFEATVTVLKKGIDFGGDSMSDYRRMDGTPGEFQHKHNAYRLTGKPCKKPGCKGVILRIVTGGRSGHFCSVHQKLFG